MELEIDVDLNGFDINSTSMDRSTTADEELGGSRSGDTADTLTPSLENGIISKPNIGMEFNSHDDAYACYEKYAKGVGFGTSKITSRRSKTFGYFIDVKFACTKYGVKKSSKTANPQSTLKIDCKAFLHVKRRNDGKWYVHNFVEEHNHELLPDLALFFSCHRGISDVDKRNIDALHSVGVPPSRIFAAITKQYGGRKNVNCIEKDIRNYIDKERRLASKFGDANLMLEHFIAMQQENPNFFYAIDMDEERHLKHVFWVDAKGREDYKSYSDVVSFDTTYITNQYKILFAPFVGVNNHFQSTIFGCALLSDETTSTFIWVMNTWLRAMGGEAPKSILTDQDKAIRAAIAKVFPNVRHRFCLWHIMRKNPEKIGQVTQKYENFMGAFKRCIYKTWTEEDFEINWLEMIKKFGLQEEEWLLSLYDDRKQ